MCGIAGIFFQDSDKTPSELQLSEMIQAIAHRGPDAQQLLVKPGIGLAHARLSIIDLNHSANQPMHDPATGNNIIFNGEIYNYIELRNELISLGYEFRTESDTEVILKAYAYWGIECLNRFNGMWAIAIYDERKKTLFCARDRMGIKPFVYGITSKKELIFASESKAITKIFTEFNRVNHPFLHNFIERDFFACYKETFYKNLFNLLPGHYFCVKAGENPQQIRYWSWKPQANFIYQDDDSIKSQFLDLLTDAIKLRFRSDVAVGSCLSGGLDSSTIVGIASQLFNKRIATFSCVYPNTPAFDESSYIQASVNKFDAISKLIEPGHDDFISLMQTSNYEQDGPTGGPSILSQRAVMELVAQDVKVVLNGQGADELLGGYHSYFRYSLLSNIRSFRKHRSLQGLWDYWSNSEKIKKRMGYKISNFFELMRCSATPVSFSTSDRSQTQLGYFSEFEGDDLNTLLLEHFFTSLTNLLHYEDRNSMRVSVESRLPFLDYRLIEFVFSLPARYKIRGSTTKWLLHSIAKDILPPEVLNRKDKMGFSTPAHLWFMQGDNMKYFKRYLNSSNPMYAKLSQAMRDCLTISFKQLSTQQNVSPASAGSINALWRFFTANMWSEQID